MATRGLYSDRIIIKAPKIPKRKKRRKSQKRTTALFDVIKIFISPYVARHAGVSTISQVIMTFMINKPKTGTWILQYNLTNTALSPHNIYRYDGKVQRVIKINDNLSFDYKTTTNMDNDTYFDAHYQSQPLADIQDLSGCLKIINTNRYLMLFDYKIGTKLLKTRRIKKKLFDVKRREKVYSKRVIELYLKHLDIEYKELKEMHRDFIQQYLLNSGVQYSAFEEQYVYDHYQLDWNVLSMKLKDDIQKGYLRHVNKRVLNKTEDVHMLYVYLCRHFNDEPEKMYVDDFCILFSNKGQSLVIKLNGKSVFANDQFVK